MSERMLLPPSRGRSPRFAWVRVNRWSDTNQEKGGEKYERPGGGRSHQARGKWQRSKVVHTGYARLCLCLSQLDSQSRNLCGLVHLAVSQYLTSSPQVWVNFDTGGEVRGTREQGRRRGSAEAPERVSPRAEKEPASCRSTSCRSTSCRSTSCRSTSCRSRRFLSRRPAWPRPPCPMERC
jgi:hypothetical protein